MQLGMTHDTSIIEELLWVNIMALKKKNIVKWVLLALT